MVDRPGERTKNRVRILINVQWGLQRHDKFIMTDQEEALLVTILVCCFLAGGRGQRRLYPTPTLSTLVDGSKGLKTKALFVREIFS